MSVALIAPILEDRDTALAHDVAAALRKRFDVPAGVHATVRDGTVTLTGAVAWMYQKAAAERTVKSLHGVRGVTNGIEVNAVVSPGDVRARIVEALRRFANADALRLTIDTEGRAVMLSGCVRSWVEKTEAERAAWTAPGVAEVRSNIEIVP